MKTKSYMPQSQTVEWETPQKLFDELNKEFQFTVDVAASEENHKLTRYYSISDNGLNQSWDDEIVWCNPPYGRVIRDWVEKAFNQKNGITVMLIPARTDTIWFHEFIYNKSEIRFIKGRLKFGGNKNLAPFPNMIVIFRSKK